MNIELIGGEDQPSTPTHRRSPTSYAVACGVAVGIRRTAKTTHAVYSVVIHFKSYRFKSYKPHVYAYNGQRSSKLVHPMDNVPVFSFRFHYHFFTIKQDFFFTCKVSYHKRKI